MRRICASAELVSGGKGVRFSVRIDGREEPAFVIRHRDVVYGYLNRCAHVPTELDWTPGDFFESDGRYLICATHGALYFPESGDCVAGRCNGKGLRSLHVVEVDGAVFLIEEWFLTKR